MNKDLFEFLKEKFPFLSNLRYISCGDGWFYIIRDLSQAILELNPPDHFEIVQIKEKFGGLRYYWKMDQRLGDDNHPYMMIEEDLNSFNKRTEFLQNLNIKVMNAESNSYITCEECGKPASSTSDGFWVKTLCDFHKEERKNGKI